MSRKKRKNPLRRPVQSYAVKKPKVNETDVLDEGVLARFIDDLHLDVQIWRPFHPRNLEMVLIRIFFFADDCAGKNLTCDWYPIARLVVQGDMAGLARLLRASPPPELPQSSPLGRQTELNSSAARLSHCTPWLSEEGTLPELSCTLGSSETQDWAVSRSDLYQPSPAAPNQPLSGPVHSHPRLSFPVELNEFQPELNSLSEDQSVTDLNKSQSGVRSSPRHEASSEVNASQSGVISPPGCQPPTKVNESQSGARSSPGHQPSTEVNESQSGVRSLGHQPSTEVNEPQLGINSLHKNPYPAGQNWSQPGSNTQVSLQWNLDGDQWLVVRVQRYQHPGVVLHCRVTTNPLPQLSAGVRELGKLSRAGQIRLCASIPSEVERSNQLLVTVMVGNGVTEKARADSAVIANRSLFVSALVRELHPKAVDQVQPQDDVWLRMQTEDRGGWFWS